MFSTCNGRFLIHSLVVSLLVLAAGPALFGGEVKKLTRDDGKKLPAGKTRPALKLHLDDTVVVRLDQRTSLGHHWVESPDSTKLLEEDPKNPRKSAPNSTSNNNGVGGSIEDVIITFRFKANASPTDQPQYLRLNLVQGKSKEAIDTFEVPIQVIK
jgi:hypothetical protein